MFFYKETSRLILRSPKSEDALDFAQKRSSPFVLKYNLYSPCDKERVLSEFENNFSILIILKETNTLIGEVRIKDDGFRFHTNSKELQFWLTEDCARQGYMTETLNFIIDFLFSSGKADKIAVRVFSENVASCKLVEKLGFNKEGYLKNAIKNYDGKIFDLVCYVLENG